MLKFARKSLDQFSFDWSKVGDDDTALVLSKPNTVSFQSVREEDFGHYQCDVKDAAAGKVLLTLYTALYKHQSSQLSNLKYHLSHTILSSVISTYHITWYTVFASSAPQ